MSEETYRAELLGKQFYRALGATLTPGQALALLHALDVSGADLATFITVLREFMPRVDRLDPVPPEPDLLLIDTTG